MQGPPSHRLLAGIGFVAGTALALQVLLTRLFSAALFYHFGFLAISLALVGTGGAAMLVYVRRTWFTPPAPASSLALWCVALAVSLAVAPAVLVHLFHFAYGVENSLSSSFLVTLAGAALLASIPFFMAGLAITLAITRFTPWIHRVYAFDLVGAGAGALLIVPALWHVPVPTLIAALGIVAGLAALLLANSRRELVAVGVGAGLATLGVVLSLTTSLYRLPLTFPHPVTDRWTPLSRVAGYVPSSSSKFAYVTYDRDYAPVPRHPRGQPLPTWRDLRLGPQSIGFAMAPPGRVLVIGGGGGRDIYNALSAGEQRVDVIELNRSIVRVVDGDLGASFGSPYTLPGVHVSIGDGRSTLARSSARYQEINIGFTNTLSGNAAQGYALTENNLYTREAFAVYLDHLAPGGVLSVSRIYRLVGDEALRATVLTLSALKHRGIPHPERNVVVLLGRDLVTRRRFGTILARTTPFTAAELATIRRLARQRGDGVAYAPGGPYQLEWGELARAHSLESFCSGYRVDICPPTDDKPFFLNFERLSDVGAPTPHGYLFTIKPFTVLLVALAVLVVLCVLAFVSPLALARDVGRPTLPSLGFFASIGLGYVLLEVIMIQRFVLFLGFPAYSLSIVLAALLATTGAGAFLSQRWRRPERALSPILAAAAVLIVSAAFALEPVLRALIAWPFGARVAVAAAILAPFGLLLGMAMPIGLRRLHAAQPAGVAWAWGVNGLTSVLASVLAMALAITWGFRVATLAAAGCYALAAAYARYGAWEREGAAP